MLGVGIDWAEEFHLVALGRLAEGVIGVVRAGPHPEAVSALVARIAGLEPDPAEVRVVIERGSSEADQRARIATSATT